MTKLATAQQLMHQQGAELSADLDRGVREVTDSVVRMSEEIRRYIEKKRAESRRVSRDNLKAVKP